MGLKFCTLSILGSKTDAGATVLPQLSLNSPAGSQLGVNLVSRSSWVRWFRQQLLVSLPPPDPAASRQHDDHQTWWRTNCPNITICPNPGPSQWPRRSVYCPTTSWRSTCYPGPPTQCQADHSPGQDADAEDPNSHRSSTDRCPSGSNHHPGRQWSAAGPGWSEHHHQHSCYRSAWSDTVPGCSQHCPVLCSHTGS